MNRRDWMKSSALLSGGLTLSILPFDNLWAKQNIGEKKALKEIHLVNLSHHDYGYTDLPSSVWDYQVNNIRLAMKFITETVDYPPEAQFKWTLEGLWTLERFWTESSVEEKRLFEKYVTSGHLEVTAMPGNMTCLIGKYEWEKELDRLKFFSKKFKPAVALQDDVNGLPWGMVDSLLNRNISYITMAANAYHGGYPIPPPSFFWWEGASKKKILMYNSEGYAVAYDYFHTGEWRKGPVPHRYDVWFNPPTGNEIFSTRMEDMLASQKILNARLVKLSEQGYNLSAVQLTFTNHWTIDNDQPCRQLSEFVKSWNEAKLEPKLVFSTPAKFIGKIKPELGGIPTLRGEWSDWWADGIAASPTEVALLQAAKRRNKDIGAAQKYFEPYDLSVTRLMAELSQDLTFASEHTWGAYDSVGHPYSARTVGNHAQKFDPFFKSDEDSKRIQAAIIRGSKNYKPFSQTTRLHVLNPGSVPRSGWAELSAVAFRKEANAVKDLATGRILPFEQTLDSEWNWRGDSKVIETPVEFPNDVWPFLPAKNRFFVADLKPGEKRAFEIVNDRGLQRKPLSGSRHFEVKVDAATGYLKNIIFKPLNKALFAETGDRFPGQLIVERPQGKYSRDALAERKVDSKNLLRSYPTATAYKKIDSHYALRYSLVSEEQSAKRIEQQWDIFDAVPRIELTTTIWLKENLDPLAIYLAFPFAIQSPRTFYDSLGTQVEVGLDQMPNTCGEYNTIQNGVRYTGRDISIALTSLDLPVGIFDDVIRGKFRPVFKPQTGNFFSIVCQNYWITNFAVLHPAKIVARHIIECAKPGEDIFPVENNELWCYPSV